MKKFSYIFLALFCALSSFAQTTIFTENFSSATPPGLPAGWVERNIDQKTLAAGLPAIPWGTAGFTTYDGAGNKFAITPSWFNPVGQADRWLISPSIIIPATGEIYLSWFAVSAFGPPDAETYEVKVSPTNDTTRSSFTTVTTITDEPGAVHNISLNAYHGTTIRLAFRNITDDGGYLIIDDIKVHIPALYDVTAVSLDIAPTSAAGSLPVDATIYNNGSETVNTLGYAYTVNGGAPVVGTITGLNILPFTTASVSATALTTTAGMSYDVSFTAATINSNVDVNIADNTATALTLTYPSPAVPRTPLFEIFTSSTCGPCVAGNINFHAIVDPKPADEYVSIKYQQDFPGTGDPYSTTESVNRRDFYAINSIPRMEIDGGWDGNAASFTDPLYTTARNTSAFADMTGTYVRNDAAKSFGITINYTPKLNLPASSATLFVAILENQTSQNVKTNGETSFLQVMKKMIPDENGNSLGALTAGTPVTYTGSYTFTGSFRLPADGTAGAHINHATENSIEEITDCRVVAWLQLDNGLVVLQAANLAKMFGTSVGNEIISENSVELYPNPANESTNISFVVNQTSDVTVTVSSANGQFIEKETGTYTGGKQTISIKTSDLPNGTYFVNFSSNNENITKSFIVAH